MTRSNETTFLKSQIVLKADGSGYRILAWGGPCYDIGDSVDKLLDWMVEQLRSE